MPPGLSHASDHDTFGVYAPAATGVDLVVLGGDDTERASPLTPDPAGSGDWTTRLEPLPAGTRYGLRATGPYDPEHGQVFDPALLLLDPYARAVTTHRDRPVAVAVDREIDAGTAWAGHARPVVAADERVVAEVHVRGYTRLHPGVPEALRGTFAGLAAPAVTDHLRGLGVTTVELLPIHHFLDEPRLTATGLANYWGYNTAAFFAPHAPYSSRGSRGGQVADIREMVAGLHAAGLEVLLDVVYNHTSEQGLDGVTTGLRGLADAATYRRVNADGSGAYLDVTGCGNTLDTTHPRTLSLVMDSLRYWLSDIGVDGFRFDLTSALARTSTARGSAFDPLSPFLAAIAQDPVCRGAVLVAEPWDVSAGGYQLGGFGPCWAEWNDRFRDTSRQFWRRFPGSPDGLERRHTRRVEPAAAVRDLASRLAGSSDVFAPSGRGPLGSLNFVTAHDGFTLADVVSYDRKHNVDNGEDDRDGTSSNHSWNHGVEGPTTDPAVQAARLRTMRNLLATLLLSAGTPMLLGGDETGRTQGGNNNAYCHDDPRTWVDWSWLPTATRTGAVPVTDTATVAGAGTGLFAGGEPATEPAPGEARDTAPGNVDAAESAATRARAAVTATSATAGTADPTDGVAAQRRPAVTATDIALGTVGATTTEGLVARLLPAGAAQDLLAWTTGLLRLRSHLPLLRPTLFLRGEGPHPDLVWLRADGSPVAAHDWWSPARQTLGMLRLPGPDRPGSTEPALLLWLHAEDQAELVRLPAPGVSETPAPGAPALGWALLADSATGELHEPGHGPLLAAGTALRMAPRSLRLLEAVQAPR